MPIKKKKISELTLSDNLKGLYTIGVKLINGIQTSVKVSLEYIQTAYENAVAATDKANQAATNANNSRLQIEKNESTRQSNESARVSAESKRASAETQRQTAEEERESNEVIRQQQEAEREQALKKYLPLTGGTMSGDLQFASYGDSGERGIKAVMAANDYWGIVGRSTEDNKGILEIYTGDDGGSSTYNEIVKFSQYAGARTVESKPVKEFVVFDKSGNTSIPGVVSMGSTLTLRGNRGNADVFTDFNGGRGIVIRVTDSSGVLHELGMWNNGQPVYIKDNGKYYLYHTGNLGIATSTKSGLVKSGENIKVNSDGTMTIDNAPTTSVKDPAGEWTLRKFVDDLLNVLSGGNGNDLEAALSHLRSSFTSAQTNLAAFIEEVNTFLNDSDLSDSTINRWKEIESFLAGITDTETLTGLLAENLQSAKSYADTKVQQGTANAVTMSANAGAADRVLISAGTNKTAKDSGISIKDLARKEELPNLVSDSENGLMSSEDKSKLDTIETNANNYTLPIANNSTPGGVKSGGDIVVGSDGTVSASGKALRITNGGVGRYYKFMSFDIGGDKGMIRFGIFSPLLGYGEFLIDWGWQGSTEKHCYPYCLFSTNAQMYNRVKLVRTGGSTFDVYFESNPDNDYATFVFMGQSGTSVKSFSASGVSSIPTVYKESAYAGNFYFGTITGTLSGTADNTNKLGNYGLFTSPSGSPAGHVPLIGTDGVMEAGCYIDFHANGDTSDYNLRLMYDEDTKQKRWVKFPKASGYLAIGNETGTAKKAAGISFSNNSDAIDIDRYTQGELGTIHIWLNGNQADGNVPDYPENGVVIQSHFRFENDEGEYKYRYTQMFVGKNGTLYSRTSAEGSTLGFTPSSWEEWNRSGCYYFYLGEMTVGNTIGNNAAEVTFSSGSSAFSALKAILDTYPNSAGYITDIQLCFALKTSSTTQYIRAKMLSLLSISTGVKTLFFLYQNALYGESNYLNVLRMVFSPSSSIPSCNTLNMKI